MKLFGDGFDENLLTQVKELEDSGLYRDIVIMPDAHYGEGVNVGFTGRYMQQVSADIIGADIGCGMSCYHIDTVSNIDFQALETYLRSSIEYDREHLETYKTYYNLALGTLGDGNHFVEISKDSVGGMYIIIHTGSRNLGGEIHKKYAKTQKRSKKLHIIKDFVKNHIMKSKRGEFWQLFDNALPWNDFIAESLCDDELEEYLSDMRYALDFAFRNRQLIAKKILDKIGNPQVIKVFDSPHNFIDDDKLIRKGACSAKYGQDVIIPINMRDGTILGVGKGNAEWNFSAPHGGGRVMSRGVARRTLKYEDYKKTMEGITTFSVNSNTIDESPDVYKKIDYILENIKDTVSVIDILKPIYNYKGFGRRRYDRKANKGSDANGDANNDTSEDESESDCE